MLLRLETSRLTIRHFTAGDAQSLFDLDHDPEVVRYIGPFVLDSPAAYEERIHTVYAAYSERTDGLGLWAVIERETGRFAGWVCLRPAAEYRFASAASFLSDDAELGYRLMSWAWGRGYATEASQELIADIRTRSPQRRIVATALESNGASIRVMEKCGLRFTGRFQLPGFDVASVRYELNLADCCSVNP